MRTVPAAGLGSAPRRRRNSSINPVSSRAVVTKSMTLNPRSSLRRMSAPASKRHWTTGMWPLAAAMHSGVMPPLDGSSGSMRAARRAWTSAR
ncbi:hypothetical protein BDV10DRAFT_176688 [Aspergillus recurvatus]